ncbi:Rid family hydrolase [Streptomyces colonosanans]|uniref:RidA family protein n=1 Tax=Streptomyces colonosanans TaxID=1428652 RepID=A0A1S2NUY9_9ACTN|nr:Rid family hydrolase [Streptomyces colonosanans]OIJ84986.1 hypothetical protein BIV24_29585 [Streptomyces colonosanans]
MSERRLIATGTRFEKFFGYSRAVRVEPWVTVAGCTAAGPDGGANIAAQNTECLRRIESARKETGASLEGVVRARFYASAISPLEAYGVVHVESFTQVRPASTIVEAALAHPSLLVEAEADAITNDLAGE